jgi:hypothetical protein
MGELFRVQDPACSKGESLVALFLALFSNTTWGPIFTG